MRCLMPIAASPASYIPGLSEARGSVASDPVMPAGNGGAGWGANGFAGAGLAGLVSAGFADSGAGDGEVACASVLLAKHEHKITEVTSKRRVVMRIRFIVSPPRVFLPAWFA